MPTEDKKTVDIDTSGPGAEIDIEEQKDESVVETEAPKEKEAEAPSEEPVETKQEEEKQEPKKQDEQLEDYSKGVQARIAKLTRKMREAERQRDAATEYAKSVEEKRLAMEKRFEKTDADYIKKFETSINTGLEAAQKELAAAIEAGDAQAQVEANKRIATLAFENAKLSQSKEAREQQATKPSEVRAPAQPVTQAEPSDPMAEAWAAKNSWFGQDRAMTYTAFEIHKDLVDKEGYDPKSDEYYAEIDKRIRVDFPHKFAKSEDKQSTNPVQTVASAKRSVRPGRKTVKLTSSQVAIAKKLGVPLEEYAKQIKTREERNMEKENKTSRASQTRSKSERPKVWVPPSSLDAPPAPDGFRYRWIRAETVGFQDTKNIAGRLREGYELVRAEEVENAGDYPVLEDGKYKGVIGVGGLLLAKVPVEIAKQRQDYMTNRHKERNEAVENDLMKEQDQRMPINVERQSRVTFGGTKK